MKKEILHIYVRVSGDKSAKMNNSIPAQREAGIQTAKRNNMEYRIHREGDINTGRSATKDDLRNRPILQKLLDLCKAGEVKHIFYTEWDRLARTRQIAANILEIVKEFGILLYDSRSVYDIKNNPQHELMLGINSVLSQHEIRQKNERIVRSLGESAKKGNWSGGVMLPYGFRRERIPVYVDNQINRVVSGVLEIHPEESKIIQRIYNLSLQGKGGGKIADILNNEGVLTRGRKSLSKGLKLKNRRTGEPRIIKPENIIWRSATILGILKKYLPIY